MGKNLLISVRLLLLISAGPLVPGAACAQSDVIDRLGISGSVDARIIIADGETNWQEGGNGKLRFDGNSNGDAQIHAAIADAHILVQPTIGAFKLHLDGRLQQSDHVRVGLNEAWIAWKPVPSGATRISARAGLFYPPTSMEHDGPGWTTTRTITPSAINSWIGEEVKVVGLEGKVSFPIGEHEISATGGLFGGNDTSGTLLTFRGWALHDVGSNAFQRQPLPKLSDFAFYYQAAFTTPVYEIDKRLGFYGHVEWRLPERLSLNLTYYDNRGDPEAYVLHNEWGWRTRYFNLGMLFDVDDKTQIIGQAMRGNTKMGFHEDDGQIWFDNNFRSAYLLGSRDIGSGKLTVRGDYFAIDDNTNVDVDDNSETGWALTGAYMRPISSWARVGVEVMRVKSDRPARLNTGAAPKATQNQVQLSFRVGF